MSGRVTYILSRNQQSQNSLARTFKVCPILKIIFIEETITIEHQREKMIYFESAGSLRLEEPSTVQ